MTQRTNDWFKDCTFAGEFTVINVYQIKVENGKLVEDWQLAQLRAAGYDVVRVNGE